MVGVLQGLHHLVGALRQSVDGVVRFLLPNLSLEEVTHALRVREEMGVGREAVGGNVGQAPADFGALITGQRRQSGPGQEAIREG